MRLKRDLFFTLILFLIIFSISFVSASELTYDTNTDELTTLSVSDVNSIDEDLNDVKLDSVEANSNDELIDSVDDNLDESELNSIDDTSSPSLDLEDDEQDIDEIESNDCLTLNDKAQLLRASDNEEILRGDKHLSGGTAQQVLEAIRDASNEGGGTVYLHGGTYTGTAGWGGWGWPNSLSNVRVVGGSYIGDPTMAKFTGGGYVFTINDIPINNCIFENLNFTNSMFWFAGRSGSISNSAFNNLQSSVQGLCFIGDQGSNRQYPITNVNFTNVHHIYNPNVAQGQYNEFDDGHGQLIAAFGIKMDHCNFVNTSSTNHGGAICIADESRWGSRTVPSIINNTNFIGVESKWFAVYIHANFSDSGNDHITSPEIVENCNFINCTGTEEYSACLGISHDDLIVKNCNFVNNTGGQGAAIMVGGLTNADGSLDDAAFNGRNTKGNNISIIGCNFTDNFASRHDTLANQSGLYNYPDGSSGNAGAIYVFGNDTKIVDCKFNNNTAQNGSGAAIYIVGHRTVINGSEFYNHNSDNGTVFIVGDNTTINNSNFHDNEAVYTGACIYIDGDNTKVTDSTFRNNKAENGAGVYIKGQNTNIASSTFDSNNATDGGAAYINGHNSVISSNTFTKNNVTDQGGAIFIQGSGSTIRGNTFTENEAVPASAEGTTGLGGAIYVKGDNTLTDTNTFEHNKARNGSAIYTDGKNFNLQHDVFNENQAWSYLLIVDPVPKVSYYNTTDHNITIVHVGGDNIINAIHNTANNNEIHFLDVTYRHSDGDTVNTGDTVVEPVDGAREGVLYQDDRENLQEIFVTVTHVESGDIILNYERYVTNIYGEVNITLKRPTRAVIQLDNPLPVGNYSVYAIHPEDWNYKVIENRSAFEILPYVDISTEKDSDKDEYYVGDTAIWTITVDNADNGTNATNVTVTDKLPSGFAFVSYVASQGNYDADTGIWTIGNMTNGSSVQLTIYSVATFADDYNNIANASSNETDWNLTNNEDNKTVKVLPVVNLTIDKSVNVDVVYVGENVIFTINVTNNGPSNATMVKVEDVLPEQFEYVTSNDTSFSGNQIIIPKLNVEDSYLFTITAKTLINGTWNNTANATCKENDTVVNDTATVTVLPVVNLTIDKSVDLGHIKVGDTVVFTINVTNNGPSNATNVVIEDVVPAQFNVTGCSDPRFENNKITISYLNKGESIQFTITAIALINGTWNNTANVTCAENDTVVNDTVEVIVDPVVNLTIDKAVDIDHVFVGDTVVFTINVTNNGPSNATVVTIEDIVPEQFQVIACNDSAFSGNKITVDKLNVGESYAFTITATALIAGTWNNTANATCKENDTVVNDTVTVIVDPVVNLTINKTVDNNHVEVGETVVFTINVTNNGPSNATVVIIEDVVPTQFGNVVCNDSRYADNKITIDQLNKGDSIVFTLTATALIAGTWNNTASVFCKENDTIKNDTVNVTVDPVVNLTIDKTVDLDHVHVGDTVVFTINVTNNGPSNATVVVIEDVVPTQFNVTACNDTQFANNKITVDKLNVGESYAFTITAIALINGTWNNTANATCEENDTVVNDTVTVVVDPVVNLTIDKAVDYDHVQVGDTIVFTINVTNNGPSNATVVTIEDIVPEQFNVTACNDSAFINNKIIIEKLNVGESYAFTITATALINGTWNNTANVTCKENDTVVNDTVTVIVDPVVNLSINKTVEPGRVYVGETVLFIINITNNGPSNATQVEVTDIVPEQFGNIICNDSAYSNNKIIIAKLNVGESYVFTLNATALINGTWDNVASAFCAENDTVVEDDAIVIVDPVVNLTVNKTVEPGKVYVGETVVFTINVTNNGPSNATMVEITDVVPEQFGNVACNDTRFENNKIIIERLDVNESIVFTLTATALINGTWNNTASAFCAENDTEVNDTVNVTVDPIVDVSTEKTSDKDVYFIDDIAIWTITVHNANNASNATNVKLIESLPSEFEYIGYLTLNGTYDNETKIWDIGFMANGTDAELYIFARAIKVKVNVTNIVSVTCTEKDWNLSNNIANKTVDIIPLPDPEKNVSNSTPYYHDEVLYYLTISNTGNVTYENMLKVIDSLPEGLEFIRTVSIENAEQVGDESVKGQTITWTITNIPAFTKAVITVLVKVNALGNLTNNLTVVGPNGTNQTVNATIDPVPIVDLSTNKTSDKEAYFVDDIVIWSITVHNADNGTNATDVILKDEIPSQFEFINYTATKGTYDKETGIWNISFMENGTDATLTIWTIAKVAVDQVTNTANVTCKETDWNLSNNVDNETVEIIPLPDPVKTVSNSTPYYHDIVEYNLTIINNGDIDYTNNLTVVDSLPEGLVFIETVGIVNGKFIGDEVIGTNNVTWVVTNISAKTNATIIVKVKVEALGDLTNNLTIIGPNGTNKTVNETVTPVPIVDLSTDKTSDRDEYFVDDIAVWTITVHNADNGTNATNVALEDHIPTQFVFINYTATNGTYDHNTGIWTIGFMGNGTDATLTIWTRAVTPIDEVTNYANVSCYEDEWDLSNNDDEKTVSIIKLPEPQKTVSNTTPYNRDNVTYNLTITNVGNITYTNVLTVIDSLPEGLKFIETVGIDGADLIEEIVDGQKITWTITNISAESSAVITVKVLVMDIGNQTNNLTIVGPNGTNSTVNCTIDPVPIADLAVTKINDYSTKVCYNGDNVTWTISVINNGPNDAINSIASDILPAGLIYVSDDSNGAYDPITGIWTIGNLSVGSSATLTIVTTVATSNETITNYVNVTSDTYDPDESNNEDNSSVVVEPEADLGIIKLVSNETVHKGDIVTWTLIVTNYGTDAAINVVVTDKLPKGLVHIADNSLGAYNPVTGIWKVGNLACGESATLKIKSLVKTTNKNITNLATVDSDTYDPDKSNNNANNSTIVPPECDLVLTIDPNVVEVTVGDEVEFTVTVVNKGPDTAENATAFIEIPDELKLLGFKPSKGTYDPETGIWTIGDLAPGEKVTLILDTEALETGKFVVKAHVVCDTYETNYTNNNDSAEVTVIEPPEPPVPDVPPQEMYPTGNPIVLALLSVLVIVGMTLRRKS